MSWHKNIYAIIHLNCCCYYFIGFVAEILLFCIKTLYTVLTGKFLIPEQIWLHEFREGGIDLDTSREQIFSIIQKHFRF